jgi:biopolymer transport protein TolR
MQTSGRRKRRKLKSEINVVPYIDVMLVLLIIFMVTAPLLNLGVDIHLPQAAAKSVQDIKEPVLVSVDKDGNLFLTLGAAKREPTDADDLVRKVSGFVRQNPQVSVMIGGDERVDYGKIYQAMALLQQAGVPKVGLMSQPVQESKR